MPCLNDDRRIGLKIPYLATHVKQTRHELDTAVLARSVYRYRYFGIDVAAKTGLSPEAVAATVALEEKYRAIAGS